jgi:dihydrofolate reductase
MEIVVAMNAYSIIGANGTIPWNVPEDLKRFFQLTVLGIVVMGRKTFLSLPNGPLSNRINIVVTHTPEIFESTELLYFVNETDVFSLINRLRETQNRKVFIIGGEEIYKMFLPHCNKVYMTLIHKYIEPNTSNAHFPVGLDNITNEFKCAKVEPVQFSNTENCIYQFLDFERI